MTRSGTWQKTVEQALLPSTPLLPPQQPHNRTHQDQDLSFTGQELEVQAQPFTTESTDTFFEQSALEDKVIFIESQKSECVVRGRLRSHLSFWEGAGASQFVLSVISCGYYLPFVSNPLPYFAPNHRSADRHSTYVSQAIQDLLHYGSIISSEKSQIVVRSPLGVVGGKKLRLILDLRYLNSHIAAVKFKYDDNRMACSLASRE